jgi:hypothetical protein
LGSVRGAISPLVPQELLALWVAGSLGVGGVLLVGGARAAGAALVGSSVCCFLAYPFKRLYGGENLETLVHGGVILASVGLVGFGLAGLRRQPHAPFGRYPMALVLASGTVVVGTLLIRRIDVLAVRGFEDPWLQVLLGFNVAFLALLFLVQARRASPSFREAAEEAMGRLARSFDRVVDDGRTAQ